MSAPAWQHGYDLDELRRKAAPFKTRHAPHVYGAFGLVKEREVAAALVEGAYLAKMDGKEPLGAAIIRELSSGSTHRDFAGRQIKIAKGSHLIGAIAAYDPDTMTAMLRRAMDTAGFWKRELWVEIFEEDEIAKSVVAEMLNYQATKVMAGSEIKGLYSTAEGQAIPDDGPEDRTLSIVVPRFLNEAEIGVIRGEIDAFGDWAQHYSGYNKRHSWTAFALRGYDAGDPTFIIKPHEMSKNWQRDNPARIGAKVADTSAAEHFPMTMRWVECIPGPKDRVRFMKVAPGGGELTRHADITDRDAGVALGHVVRLHIPIITNPGVIFQAWSKRGKHLRTSFPQGALCYLDQRKPHAVVNGGDSDRIHLVVDTISTPTLREWLAKAKPAEPLAA